MKVFLIPAFFLFAISAFAQDAHYTYPFEMSCPDKMILAGETATITIDNKGQSGDMYRPVYNWMILNGAINSGQGTEAITVETTGVSGPVTVTLDRGFTESHFPGVQKTASCTFTVAERPKARLIDEFVTHSGNCEEAFARLDGFFIELNNNPTDQGHIVIYGDPESRAAEASRRSQIRNHIILRRFDPDRVAIVSGSVRERATVQFWLVPLGADPPEILPADAEYKKPAADPDPSKPYVYATEFSDGIPGCSGNLYDLGEYAKVLMSDTGTRGKIVIGETSPAKFRAKEREIRAELTAAGVVRSRVTTVFKRVRRNSLAEFTELWVIPPRSMVNSVQMRLNETFRVSGEPNVGEVKAIRARQKCRRQLLQWLRNKYQAAF